MVSNQLAGFCFLYFLIFKAMDDGRIELWDLAEKPF